MKLLIRPPWRRAVYSQQKAAKHADVFGHSEGNRGQKRCVLGVIFHKGDQSRRIITNVLVEA